MPDTLTKAQIPDTLTKAQIESAEVEAWTDNVLFDHETAILDNSLFELELVLANSASGIPVPSIRFLAELRQYQFDRNESRQNDIRERAKIIAKRDKSKLTGKQKKLIAELGLKKRPRPAVQQGPWRGGKGKKKGLDQLDPQAYQFWCHGGDWESPTCLDLAEKELDAERAPDWGGHCRTPWQFAIDELWVESGCSYRPGPDKKKTFDDPDSFEHKLFEAARCAQISPSKIEGAVLEYLREQDKDGFMDKVRERVSRKFPDAAKAMGWPKADTTTGPNATDAPGVALPPSLDAQAATVVKVLGSQPSMLLGTVTIADLSRRFGVVLGRHTVGERLSRLITQGIASRPDGKRKGATLTKKGRALHESLSTSSP